MAYDEQLADRVRALLAHLPKVEEKKMFGGIAFMVNKKMCVTVGPNRIMCRIDPAFHKQAIEQKGVRTVKMGGREYIGYVHVALDVLKSKSDLNYWVKLALAFNTELVSSKSRKK